MGREEGWVRGKEWSLWVKGEHQQGSDGGMVGGNFIRSKEGEERGGRGGSHWSQSGVRGEIIKGKVEWGESWLGREVEEEGGYRGGG